MTSDSIGTCSGLKVSIRRIISLILTSVCGWFGVFVGGAMVSEKERKQSWTTVPRLTSTTSSNKQLAGVRSSGYLISQ